MSTARSIGKREARSGSTEHQIYRTSRHRGRTCRLWHRAVPLPVSRFPLLPRSLASILAALLGSLLFLFLVAPIAQLVATGGVEGGARLPARAQPRPALRLTAGAA